MLNLNILAIIAASALTFWPVLDWYCRRTIDTSDEPWGLLALASLAIVAIAGRKRSETSPPLDDLRRALPFLFPLIVAYAAVTPFTPILARACIAAIILAIVCTALIYKRIFHAGVWGLALLSLPILPSLQFFCGFPLRILITQAAAAILRIGGLCVAAEGTGLSWQQHYIGIDAACSGISMLWTSVYLALVLACIKQFNQRKAVLLLGASVVLAIAGNLVRALGLFVLAVVNDILTASHNLPQSPSIPAWLHEGTGLVAFGGTALLIVACAIWLQSREKRVMLEGSPRHMPVTPRQPATRLTGFLPATTVIACMAAAIIPALPICTTIDGQQSQQANLPDWPEQIDGHRLTAMALDEADKQFAQNFPGRIGKFTDGCNQYILRWVDRPTRQLHPPTDCFRGLGYQIEPLPCRIDEHGKRWAMFQARKGTTLLTISTQVVGSDKQTFTDVSDWYWSALFGKSKGPWLSITVASPVPTSASVE